MGQERRFRKWAGLWSGATGLGLVRVDHSEHDTLAEVTLPAEWLADLYDPRLVITPDYVGTDRRHTVRAGRRGSRHLHTLAVVLATTAAVVPLTLLIVRSPTATPPSRPARPASTARTHHSVPAPPSPAPTHRTASVRRRAAATTTPRTARSTHARSRPAVGAASNCATGGASTTSSCGRHQAVLERRTARAERRALRAAKAPTAKRSGRPR